MRTDVNITSRVRSWLVVSNINNKKSARASGTICRRERGGVGVVGCGTSKPWVITVATDVCAVVPSLAITEDGARTQVDLCGSPEHASVTV